MSTRLFSMITVCLMSLSFVVWVSGCNEILSEQEVQTQNSSAVVDDKQASDPAVQEPPVQQPDQQQPVVTQAIIGQAVEVSGNQMPGPVPHGLTIPNSLEVKPGSAKGKGLSQIMVHVFKGRVVPFESTAVVKTHTQFLKTIMTDDSGDFRIELPAGVYTLVLEIDGELYRSGSIYDVRMQQRFWPPIELAEGVDSTIRLEDNRNAYY